jgi:DNA-binding NarL/FixJ family response regulator
MAPPSLLLLDRFELFRAALGELLEHEGFRVLGEAGTAQDALRWVEEFNPDIAIVEPDIPDMGGAEAVRQIRERSPGARIIVLALVASDEDAESARRLGVAYLPKDCSMDELKAALRATGA